MRILVFLCGAIVLLNSCATMTYEQWNSRLEFYEGSIQDQMVQSAQTAEPAVFLAEGVYNATREKDREPYPILMKESGTMKSLNAQVQERSSEVLANVREFRTKHAESTIKTVGPEWSNYSNLLGSLIEQDSVNSAHIQVIDSIDHRFDSICYRFKIKAVPVIDYEAALAGKLNDLENRFQVAQAGYKRCKANITEREDARESMQEINRMKQKVRQLESEMGVLNNLYGRLNSLRDDAWIFEGPYIDKMAELKLVEDKTRRASGILTELERLIAGF